MNLPWPVVDSFTSELDQSIWLGRDGQDHDFAVDPHAQSLEELMIAFSDGASFFIQPSYKYHPQSSQAWAGLIDSHPLMKLTSYLRVS